jgi:hypothetical protein
MVYGKPSFDFGSLISGWELAKGGLSSWGFMRTFVVAWREDCLWDVLGIVISSHYLYSGDDVHLLWCVEGWPITLVHKATKGWPGSHMSAFRHQSLSRIFVGLWRELRHTHTLSIEHLGALSHELLLRIIHKHVLSVPKGSLVSHSVRVGCYCVTWINHVVRSHLMLEGRAVVPN